MSGLHFLTSIGKTTSGHGKDLGSVAWTHFMSIPNASRNAAVSILRMIRKTLTAAGAGRSAPGSTEAIRRQRPLKLYVGSRDLRPEGYLAVDVDPSGCPDIVADIRDMRSVADASCEEIVAGHVLEHLEWPESFRALAECARVLGVGGRLRVAVPDLRLLLDLLVSGEADFQAAGLLFGIGGRTNPLEQHRYAFTEKMLKRVLSILGFGEFDWWTSTLPEAANGWCAVAGGTKVGISINVAARKLAEPIADPALMFAALAKRPLDDPISVVAETLGAEMAGRGAVDAPVYQRIHFRLIDAMQRIKYLETELQKAEARKAS
jgi:predicted SAM-dependent methyltransferase